MDRTRKLGLSAAIVAASLTGGALGASFISTAGAASTTAPTAATAAAAPTAPAGAPDPSKGGHVANGITEALLSGDVATKVTAAAKSAVPGATIDRVENDAEGATYEAHVTKADGSKATVKINADFSVASTGAGMG